MHLLHPKHDTHTCRDPRFDLDFFCLNTRMYDLRWQEKQTKKKQHWLLLIIRFASSKNLLSFVDLQLKSEVTCSKGSRAGEGWFLLQTHLLRRASRTLNDLALSAQNISPLCQTQRCFQHDANLSSGPFRQASIKNLEMLKPSQPTNNQTIACLKTT